MKLMILCSVFLFTGLFMVACNENTQTRMKGHTPESEVPLEIRKSFSTEYPGASDVEWKKIKETDRFVYEVEYKFDNAEWEVVYDQNGKTLKKHKD